MTLRSSVSIDQILNRAAALLEGVKTTPTLLDNGRIRELNNNKSREFPA